MPPDWELHSFRRPVASAETGFLEGSVGYTRMLARWCPPKVTGPMWCPVPLTARGLGTSYLPGVHSPGGEARLRPRWPRCEAAGGMASAKEARSQVGNPGGAGGKRHCSVQSFRRALQAETSSTAAPTPRKTRAGGQCHRAWRRSPCPSGFQSHALCHVFHLPGERPQNQATGVDSPWQAGRADGGPRKCLQCTVEPPSRRRCPAR